MRSRSLSSTRAAESNLLNLRGDERGAGRNDYFPKPRFYTRPSSPSDHIRRDVGTSTPWSVTSLQRSPSFASLASL